ncbi:hypothetical protein [Paraburkholderia pallida]|uniref:Uncharacterized protein n=1 Tax=Paraburkholderia pallida TaxID=2547399 RepID=A0A4P7CYK7_9BURK|nr:hypothetical protein [Paraburkholderia pallida]QBQ99143.1 hypothetical protein E1956_18155 [Paraburkholderia pallida]
MSYLNPLRLHFAGQFQANVSTVNNDPGHFDNAAFLPSYQLPQKGTDLNGWFNPTGDAAWRLLNCRITSASTQAGPVGANDPVLDYLIADSGSRVCAKLVDLDPEQQLVSQIWGLQVRIVDAQGNALLCGDFEPAAFMDIWNRATASGTHGDAVGGAMYQSVLVNLQWGDVDGSPFLRALRASGERLSIKFNVDGINLDFRSPQFMCGRIVGTIGPSAPDEPKHFVPGRQFMTNGKPGNNFFIPVGGINFFAAQVDRASSAILLDLGNALSTGTPGGALNDLGDLVLSAASAHGQVALGTVAAHGAHGYVSDPSWYARTAGVVALPLTAAQLAALEHAPLTLSGGAEITISEWASGAFVRADNYVFRSSPHERIEVPFYATQWGRPLAGAALRIVADDSQLQPSNSIDPNDVPPVATPLAALQFVDGHTVTPFSTTFAGTLTTDANGRALLTLGTSDPGTPRYFNQGEDFGIDGQVYGIRASLADTAAYSGPVNQWNFVSILLWSRFVASTPITWDSMHPIFQQYANLYPVMARFLDLADYDQVVAHAGLLKLAFGLDPADPNAMPVTRDLSPAKRDAILAFLDAPLPGTAAPARKLRAVTLTADELAASAAARAEETRGGKSAAIARRVISR